MTELRDSNWVYRNWETKRVVFEVEVLVPVGTDASDIEDRARDAINESEGRVLEIGEPK